MASRKTYFGIGWPKDPSEPGAPGTGDADDRSAPTVVDDEKVAEGLKQLRSWYQSEPLAEESGAALPGSKHPTPPPGQPGTRPTAVGHATGSAPAAPQRPIAPDPMRATMYGHDVHQFEFPPGTAEPTPTPQQPPPPASTALVIADPAGRQRHQAEVVLAAVGQAPSEAFHLARQGEAQRLHRPGGMRRSQPPAPSAFSRVPLASKLMFGFGITALATAIAFWVASNGSESSERPPSPPIPAPALAAPPPPVPALQPPIAVPPPQPIAPPAPRAAAPTPAARTSAAPLPAESKPARPVGAVLKVPRRPREPKRDLPTEVDEAVAGPARVPVEREKDASERDLVQPQEIKDSADLKTVRELKDAKDGKEPKSARETRPSRESKAIKESKSLDGDATLPPSTE
jgi:hypothetical protein